MFDGLLHMWRPCPAVAGCVLRHPTIAGHCRAFADTHSRETVVGRAVSQLVQHFRQQCISPHLLHLVYFTSPLACAAYLSFTPPVLPPSICIYSHILSCISTSSVFFPGKAPASASSPLRSSSATSPISHTHTTTKRNSTDQG